MQCPVCFEKYEKGLKPSVKLTCEHIVCKNCLDSFKQDFFKCPICLQDFQALDEVSFKFEYSTAKENYKKDFKGTGAVISNEGEKINDFVDKGQIKDADNTISGMKQSDIKGFIIEKQDFYYEGVKESKNIDGVEKKHKSTILGKIETVRLIVRTAQAPGIELEIPVDLRVEQLKIQIQSNLGKSLKCLLFNGKVLNNKDIIKNLSLSDNDVVYIVQNRCSQ